jgi:hypothetical protein
MIFSYNKFLRPISSTDTNIQILDNSSNVIYTLSPFSIRTTRSSNNILDITFKSGKVISISFSSNNESRTALGLLQSQIDSLLQKTPLLVDKQIENYVNYILEQNGTSGTGTSGTSGTSGTGTSGTSGTSGTGTSGTSGITGATGPGYDWEFGNGLTINGFTVSIGGTLSNTVFLNGGYNDLLLTEFDNISLTSSVFDVVADFISLDSDAIQVLSNSDLTLGAFGNLLLIGDSGLVSIGNTQGLVYQFDYSSGFVNRSLVDKGYVDSQIATSGSGTSGTSGTSAPGMTSGTSGTSGTTPTTDLALSGNLTVSGTSSLNGLTVLKEVTEVINSTPGATSSTVVYDFSTGSNWYHSSANTNYTANFINIPTDNNRAITTTIVINQGSTPYIPTAVQIDGTASTIKWSGGTASGTSNQVDIVGFTFIRSDNVWAQVLGQINTFD